jgi:hypothetical protein
MSEIDVFVDDVFSPALTGAKQLYYLCTRAELEWGDRALAGKVPDDETVIGNGLKLSGAQLHAVMSVLATLKGQFDAYDGALRKFITPIGEPAKLG